MKPESWCAAAALIALTACDDPSTAPATSRAITAREVLTLRAADGAAVERPVDLDPAVVQAYAVGDDGEWTAYAGEGRSDGTLAVAFAPVGGAWLRVDHFDPSPEPRPRNEFFWVEGDADAALDLGTWRAGRADVAHATAVPTELTLELSGLAPWQPGLDLAVVYAPNVDLAQVFSQDLDGIAGMPTNGATGSTLVVDWAGALAAPLLDAARGDRAVAMQFRFREIDGIFVGAPVRAATLPALTQADGEAAAVEVAFGGGTPLALRVAMDRDAFDALRPAIGRDVGPALGRGFAISATTTVVAEEFSLASLPAELVVLEGDALAGAGPLDLGELEIASPFPADAVFGHFVSAYPVTVARDDGVVARAQAEVGVLTDALPTAAAPAAPIVGPVRGVTIDGRDAFDGPTGVGPTPVIAWQPPALGAPVAYEVRVLAPGGADPTYDFVWHPAAIFHVPGDHTSLALPPEVLEPELPYAIAIRAISHPLDAETRAAAPRQLALPYGWADTITPAFHP